MQWSIKIYFIWYSILLFDIRGHVHAQLATENIHWTFIFYLHTHPPELPIIAMRIFINGEEAYRFRF